MTQSTDIVEQEVAAADQGGDGASSIDDASRLREETEPVTSGRSVPTWLIRLGWALLAVQLLYLMSFSLVEYQRFALTHDFSIYHQAWYLIGHGDLNPLDTAIGYPFWRSDGEFLMWPMAILGLPFNWNALWMLVLQDLFIVGTAAVVYTWVLELVRRPTWPSRLPPTLVVGTVLVLLIANPWTYWSSAFDFHMEIPGAFFLILTARSLERRRFRSTAVWGLLTALSGGIMAGILSGVGLSAIIAGRKWRKAGIVVFLLSLVWVVMLASTGQKGGGQLSHVYGYLATGTNDHATNAHLSPVHLLFGVATHPQNVIKKLWERRLNIFANIAPSGLVGVLSPWGFGVSLFAILADNLPRGVTFSAPIFQDFPLYAFVTIGTAFFLVMLSRKFSWGPRAAKILCVVLVANTLAWSLVWTPRTWQQWIRVTPAAASTLSHAEAQIPPNAEVVASQGVIGRFTSRQYIYGFRPPEVIQVHAHPVYFVVAPYQGIETDRVNKALSGLWYLTGTLHAQLIASSNGVWVFRWDPPPNVHRITIPILSTVPAWALPTSDGGSPVLTGPPATWHMASGQGSGYVVEKAYWREDPGSYVAAVALASQGPVTIDVRNADSNQLLATRQLTGTNGVSDVFIDANFTRSVPRYVYTGFGPFRIQPIPPPKIDQLEVRVSAGPHSEVDVYSIEMIAKKRIRGSPHLGE